jgi:hypothetical protein
MLATFTTVVARIDDGTVECRLLDIEKCGYITRTVVTSYYIVLSRVANCSILFYKILLSNIVE